MGVGIIVLILLGALCLGVVVLAVCGFVLFGAGALGYVSYEDFSDAF